MALEYMERDNLYSTMETYSETGLQTLHNYRYIMETYLTDQKRLVCYSSAAGWSTPLELHQ